MGTKIEFNDTLVLTAEQGFPADILNLNEHLKNPILAETLKDKVFSFHKDEARFFHIDPVRVFLVQNIDGKWLHWGHVLIQSQTIEKVIAADGRWCQEWLTSGTFKVVKIHDSDYQRQVTVNESPVNKSFF
ncbi:MAG: hypothetical protein P4L53_07615 [Candidatus Obscuribacterales bacterium]|nr:hypothetical protein [Candidatus Obscuribacterales bacterium]